LGVGGEAEKISAEMAPLTSGTTEGLLAPGSPVTLDNCHREPIHTPGGIQPHGALLAVAGSEREIVQRSENAAERLGWSVELLGTRLEDLIGAEAAVALTAAVDGVDAAGLRPRTVLISANRFDAFSYPAAAGVSVVEFEPSGTTATAAGLADDITGLLLALQTAATPQSLLDSAARWVRQLTGFDRVWVYRFEPDDHGVVIVEDCGRRLDPFLGLHFPARDIPPQARALFLQNRVRFIPDTFGTASPLVPLVNPVTGDWLDLSGGVLRAVSPMHLQYLQNLGATASLSVALEVDGRLWGLISGHHYSGPRVVEHRVRLACEVLGRVVSSQLHSLLVAEAAERRQATDEHREAILSVLAESGARLTDEGDPLISRLRVAGPALLELCAADGAAVVIGEEIELIGETPPARFVRELISAVPDHDRLFVSDSFEYDLADLAQSLAPICGVMVLELARTGGAHLVWFRHEYVRLVTWGDNGLAPARGRLHPTGSYATWSESVTGRSQPWSSVDRDAALSLAAGIGTVVLEQASALAAANRALAESNADLGAFTFIVAHDLREPLRNMQSFLGFFLEDHGDHVDPSGMEQLETVRRLGVHMNAMMDSLLDHARADRLKPQFTLLSLGRVVADAVAILGPRSSRGTVDVLTPEVMLWADPDAMMHILTNLISNATKYTAEDAPRIEIAAHTGEGRHAGQLVIGVRDFGIGIAQEHREAVFELFRRLHPRDAYGGGSGAGLAIARRLAQRQGGDMWLDFSSQAGGSRFCFSVPQESESWTAG
jgi:chemotaxis family two-component system sensor kinase Cph1